MTKEILPTHKKISVLLNKISPSGDPVFIADLLERSDLESPMGAHDLLNLIRSFRSVGLKKSLQEAFQEMSWEEVKLKKIKMYGHTGDLFLDERDGVVYQNDWSGILPGPKTHANLFANLFLFFSDQLTK